MFVDATNKKWKDFYTNKFKKNKPNNVKFYTDFPPSTEVFNDTISRKDLEAVLAKCKMNSSPGVTGVS